MMFSPCVELISCLSFVRTGTLRVAFFVIHSILSNVDYRYFTLTMSSGFHALSKNACVGP